MHAPCSRVCCRENDVAALEGSRKSMSTEPYPTATARTPPTPPSHAADPAVRPARVFESLPSAFPFSSSRGGPATNTRACAGGFVAQRKGTQGTHSESFFSESLAKRAGAERVWKMETVRVALVLAVSAATAQTAVAFGVSSPMARFGRATAVPSFLRGSATSSASCKRGHLSGATALRAQRGSGSGGEYSEEGAAQYQHVYLQAGQCVEGCFVTLLALLA